MGLAGVAAEAKSEVVSGGEDPSVASAVSLRVTLPP